MIRNRMLLIFAAAVPLVAQTVEVVRIGSRPPVRTVALTGELLPFQRVDLHARVQGFVRRVSVDRGSRVRQNDLLAELMAPELEARIAEAEARIMASEAAAAESRARLATAQSVLRALEEAAKTEGAVAGMELIQARQAAEAARNSLRAAESSVQAARAAHSALQRTAAYLEVRAPFDGVVTERLVHPGALAGPSTGPLLRLEQIGTLRLAVAVPEQHFESVRAGVVVSFTVAAHPGRTFHAAVSRFAPSLDPRTRTLAVELDVPNGDGSLAPGLFPVIQWPVQPAGRAWLVPASSIVRTTERVFVIRVRDGSAEWVDVRPGACTAAGCEIYGALSEGDLLVRNATDEIRIGARLRIAAAPSGGAVR